jgi:hypothetical protein
MLLQMRSHAPEIPIDRRFLGCGKRRQVSLAQAGSFHRSFLSLQWRDRAGFTPASLLSRIPAFPTKSRTGLQRLRFGYSVDVT